MHKIKTGIIFLFNMVLLIGVFVFSNEIVSAAEGNQESEKEWAVEWSGDEEDSTEPSEDTQITEELFRTVPFSQRLASSANGVKVIVLDPGHDNTHAGARGNGLAEEERVLKIAQYCKAELEQYEGVAVYMTRESGACPYPGTKSPACNKKRVEFAKSVDADSYVSIHLNANPNTSARGAEVYRPNMNYRSDIGTAGSRLAQSVLNELTAIGLKNRGTFYRNSENNSLYPDHSLADYYGVIKNSKLSGFPGIIIEHAFLTNASDVSEYLNTDEKLKRLGIADATGIAKYYGLHKKPLEQDYTEADLKLSAVPNADDTQYHIMAKGISNCHSVQFAVWSMDKGQDDIKWYQAQKDGSGNWNATATMSDFKTEGAYAVHTYITRSDGRKYFVCSTNFILNSDASIGRVIVSDINRAQGTFLITVQGAVSHSGVANVMIPVWSQVDQSDIIWYKAEKNGQGNYETYVKIKDHKNFYGKYQIHIYIENRNQIMKNVGATDIIYYKDAPVVSVSEQSKKGNFDLRADYIPYPESQIHLAFAVWSEENDQDDIVWHYADPVADGSWLKSIYIGDTASKGLYFVHMYVIHYDGTSELIGDTSFTITEDNAGVVVKGDANLDGSVDLTDAQLVLKAALKIQVITDKARKNADIDGDNAITLADAQAVLKIALKISK